MFLKVMQPIVLKAMERDLKNIHTYKGYNGADLLKLTFTDIGTMLEIRDLTRSLGYSTTVKHNEPKVLYCIFEVPDDVYSLK